MRLPWTAKNIRIILTRRSSKGADLELAGKTQDSYQGITFSDAASGTKSMPALATAVAYSDSAYETWSSSDSITSRTPCSSLALP